MGNGGLPERTPDEEHARLQVSAVCVDHVGGYEGDDEVEEPVGGGCLALSFVLAMCSCALD
jgi:hypothetical protein